MTGLISINGEIQPAEQAKVPALDRGFLFGDNIFEAMVGFSGQIIDTTAHLERLEKSAERIRLTLPWSQDLLRFELETLAQQAQFPKAFIRLVITRGCGSGLRVPETRQPLRVGYCLPSPPVEEDKWERGLRVKIQQSKVYSQKSAAKTGNYLESIVAIDTVHHDHYDDVLWTNKNGEVTEASTANVFFVAREGSGIYLVTPPVESGILEGITRMRILQLLKEAGIPVYEQKVQVDEIARYDEAFLSSSVKGLLPICQINSSPLYTARKNAVFHQVRRLYDAYIASQLGYYVNWNTGVTQGGSSQNPNKH
ncbi:MAG: aminotransferase class IV [Zetaproteobacteria bacterium]|nr:aminotransferase class IV [Zetaproteobacteria bacterium]